jgi:hypothetical protein
MTLTPEEKKRRHEKAIAKNEMYRKSRDRQAANREAKLKEKCGS